MQTASTQPSQIEQVGSLCAEVQMSLRGALLQVITLNPARNLCIGDEEGCDFFVPSKVLGASKTPLLYVGGALFAFCFSAGAAGSLCIDGERPRSLSSLIQSGAAEPHPSIAGVYLVWIDVPALCELCLPDGFCFQVRAAPQVKKIAAADGLSSISVYLIGAALFSLLFLFLLLSHDPKAYLLRVSTPDAEGMSAKYWVPSTIKEEEPRLLIDRDCAEIISAEPESSFLRELCTHKNIVAETLST